MWHRGDVIRARIVPTMRGSVSGSRPVLDLVIGENTRRVEGRFYQNGSRAQFFYTVQSADAAPADEVRMATVSLAGVDVDLSGFDPITYAVDGSSPGVPPVIDAIGLSSFFVPGGNVYRPGDEIFWFARFHKAVVVSGTPVLMQRIGDEMREARHRPDVQTLAGGMIFTYTVQAGDCDTDGVGILANAIRGGSILDACRNNPLARSMQRTAASRTSMPGAEQPSRAERARPHVWERQRGAAGRRGTRALVPPGRR